MNISKMTKKQIDNEFERIVLTYDFKTLLDLFIDRFDTKTKKEWIKDWHKQQ